MSPQSATGSRPKVNPWIVGFAVMSSSIMEVLDTSVVNVSLPHISGSLSSTVDEATWVLTSYIVANAIVLPITGWLANFFGRKRLLLTVVTGFTLSSLLCGLAPNLPSLIFFRVLQGTTGGGLQPLSQAVLLEEFPTEERGKAMALWGLGIMAAPIIGPTLGGWITDTFSWRWVFYINLPIGILSLILISLFVYDPPYIRRGSLRIDFWGLGMLAIGMGALQVMLDRGQEEDWFGSRLIIFLAIVALIFLTAFIIRELLIKEPIVHFGLLKNRNFLIGIIMGTMLGFVLYGSLILLPLFMQILLGWTAMTAGIWTSPRGIATACCMPLVGYLLSKKMDGRPMALFGLLAASWAFWGYSHMSLQSGTWDILLHQISQGMGMAFMFVPLTVLCMDLIPIEETGYATSLYSVMRNIGSSMGISFVTTFLARRGQFYQTILSSNINPYNPISQQTLERLRSFFHQGGGDWSSAGLKAQSLLYSSLQQQSALLSFMETFRVLAILFLVLFPLVFLLRKTRYNSEKTPSVH